MDYEENPNIRLVLAAVFAVIVVGGITDLVLDDPETWLSAHVLFEAALVLVSLGAALYLGLGWLSSERSVRTLAREVAHSRAERDAWQRRAERALDGFGAEIDRQFDAWQLTEAERETALGLLKGFSHKRLARAANRSEKTVRQHAVAVYRKSGLAGRAELAAFFLEGIALPAGARSRASASRADG